MKLNKLVSTLNMEHKEWLENRRKGIGGSDAGSICGLNPYSSAIAVFQDKTQPLTEKPDNESMRQGRDLEEYVARRFMEETGKKVRRANAIFYKEEQPFMLANVDRLIVGENAGLECKTASAYSADKWKDGHILQIGYKGLIDMVYRNDNIQTVQAQCVYENDEFEYELGLEPKLVHKPALKNRGNLLLVYALWKAKNGGFGFEVMSKEDIDIHARKYSQSFSSSYSPWKTNYEEMAKKTVIKKCLKYAPVKSDFVMQVSNDETVKSELSVDMSEIANEQEPVIDAEYNEVAAEQETAAAEA